MSSAGVTISSAPARYRYLDRLDQWEALASLLMSTKGPVAFDTEYLISDGQTPAHRSSLHVWSVAWPGTTRLNPRGVQAAVAAVLPRTALTSPGLQAWLAGPYDKWAHNAGVDRHAIDNLGVRIASVRDSLSLARWVYPGRVAPGPGFTLDALGRDLLGPGGGKTEDFVALTSRLVTETRYRSRTDRACECGAKPCRQRQSTPGHARREVVTQTPYTVDRTERFPLTDIVPGHERWDRLLAYSAQDALVGCELVQVLLPQAQTREVPW